MTLWELIIQAMPSDPVMVTQTLQPNTICPLDLQMLDLFNKRVSTKPLQQFEPWPAYLLNLFHTKNMKASLNFWVGFFYYLNNPLIK